MKPSIFIASSVEGLDIAYAVQENLEYDAEITVWDQGIFELSSYTLEALLESLEKVDFGVFVFSFDDLAKIRDKEVATVRDNVVFELGMFIGKLGKNRSFMVSPRGVKETHLPTDLLGITPATFDPNRKDGNLRAALGPTSNKIRKAIKKLGHHNPTITEQYVPLMAFHETYRKVNWNSLLERAENEIVIIVYYFDSWVNAFYESIVTYFEKPNTKMKVFVADPRDPHLLSNINRLFPEYSEEVIKEKISHTGQRFVKALKQAGGTLDRFEFYYVPYYLNYSTQCIDNSIMVLSVFEMYREMKIDSPAVVIDLDQSDHLRGFWEKEFNGILDSAERIEVEY